MGDSVPWYLVHSKPHQGSVAVLTLQWLGVEAFCPRQSPSFKVGQVGRLNEDPFLGLEAVLKKISVAHSEWPSY